MWHRNLHSSHHQNEKKHTRILGEQKKISWQEILKEISHFRPAINKEEHFCSSTGNHPITKSGPFNQMLYSQWRKKKKTLKKDYEFEYRDFFYVYKNNNHTLQI